MIKDFRLSGQKPSHRVGDFRASLASQSEENFALITKHNQNVRVEKNKLTSFSQGASRKLPNGIQTEIRCGINRKIIVKTFRDGTSVVEENNG